MLTHLSLKKSFELKRLLAESSPPIVVMLAVWVVAMLSLPLVRVSWAETGARWGIFAGVVLQAGVVILLLYRHWGLTRMLGTVAGIIGLTWGVEAVGSATGLPFGAYHYTDKLQPQLAHVPLLIPLAWLMMLPPAWAVAYQLTGTTRGWAFVGVSALALTAWDLFLDPQMVAWGLWVWENPGGYFGIPWSNYLGWLLASALITALLRPPKLPVYPLLLIYTITWLLETIGLIFFWGLPGPAVVGFVGMGSLVWLAWSKQRETH
ncbi:MAG: carotenoid biosynthesis protein [Anaerolineae bacterium]|nr:carotenoid biosynthesis protein [Anaerolineae bacterium]